jgi:hypothetical protein
VSALLHDVEFRVFDQVMCALYVRERNCRICRATNKEGRCGDLVEPVNEIAAQAIDFEPGVFYCCWWYDASFPFTATNECA